MSGLRERLMRLRGNSAQAGPAGADDPRLREDGGQPDIVGIQSALADGVHPAGTDCGRTEAAENGLNHADGSEALTGKDETQRAPAELPPEWNGLGVKAAQSPEGEFLLREIRYPLTHRHGIHGLSELALALEGLAAFDRKHQQHVRPVSTSAVDPVKVLFLDLETTGLGVGAGNVPFMVGLAYSDGSEEFVIEQTLIRHPAEERALLAYLQNKLPAFTHLVTYNGRTFDWPVLQNRFILNGFRGFVWEPVHIDLLHPSRSVWRNTLASCKLSRVEEERLGIHRDSDIPGSEAPAIYFQFLADGNPQPLLGVFKHNETDMLSLACLAIRFGHLLSERLELAFPHRAEPEELLRTGLWLDKMGALRAAEELFARVERDEKSDAACLCLLAERDKKCGNWRRAVLLWQKAVQAAERASWPGWDAHIELAMYYEHKTKQFDLALALAETALELAQRRYSSIRLDAKRRAELDAIRKRIDRLRVKTGRLSG